MSELQRLYELVNDLNQSNSTLDKQATLVKYPDCKKILSWIYDPFKQYYVTSKNIKKYSYTGGIGHADIFSLLTDLSTRQITGNAAIQSVLDFIEHQDPEYEELILNIIDKDLKTRANTKLINKVFPGCIPTFEVALAEKYDEKTEKLVKFNGEWFVSRKLDGIRCVCVVDDHSHATFYSRKGKEFHTMGKIASEITRLGLRNIVLDGEICIVDKNGNEDFSAITKEYSRKNHTIENPRYIVFDALEPGEFWSGCSNRKLDERYKQLYDLLTYPSDDVIELSSDIITPIQSEKLESEDIFTKWQTKVSEGGWEGLMIRKNTVYRGKRSKDILKVKTMQDDEFLVIDIETGPFRIIENSQEVTIETMTNIIIDFNGEDVSVGSGFTLDQRKEIYDNPSLIINSQATIQYFEVSYDKTGKKSLRFPIYKTHYLGQRDC